MVSGQNDSSGKRLKVLGSNEEHGGSKAEVEASSGSGNKSTEQVKDYIHVRARRGQATDSHSLAERVNFFKAFPTCNLLVFFFMHPILLQVAD